MAEGVLLFGASRGTGLEVARLLGARGERIVALLRPSAAGTELAATGAELAAGDVMNPEEVAGAFAQGPFRAVISTIGGRRGQTPRPDFDGNRHIVDAALAAGTPRMILVTMIGAGDSAEAVSPKVREVLGEAMRAKSQAEGYLTGSGLPYTILRPGGMTSDPATGTAIRSADRSSMGVITRADLARLIIACLDDERSIGQIWHTIDPEIRWTPPLQRGENLPPARD